MIIATEIFIRVDRAEFANGVLDALPEFVPQIFRGATLPKCEEDALVGMVIGRQALVLHDVPQRRLV